MGITQIQTGFLYMTTKEATITDTTITNTGDGFTIVIVPTKATPLKVIYEKMDKEKASASSVKGTKYGDIEDNTKIFAIGKMKQSFDINGTLKIKDINGTVINSISAVAPTYICSKDSSTNLEKYINILGRMPTIYFVRGDSNNWEEDLCYYECSLMKHEITYKSTDLGITAPDSSTIDIVSADVHLLLVRAKEMGK